MTESDYKQRIRFQLSCSEYEEWREVNFKDLAIRFVETDILEGIVSALKEGGDYFETWCPTQMVPFVVEELRKRGVVATHPKLPEDPVDPYNECKVTITDLKHQIE